MFSLACNLPKTMSNFVHQNYVKKISKNNAHILTIEICIEKSTWKQRGFFDQWNDTNKSTWKQCGFFDQPNYIEKSTWKQRGFFYHRNYIAKSTSKQRGFFDHRNYIEKVRGNKEDFYRPNFLVKSTWMVSGVAVGKAPLEIKQVSVCKHTRPIKARQQQDRTKAIE